MVKQFATNGPAAIRYGIDLSHLSDGRWIAEIGDFQHQLDDGIWVVEIGSLSGVKAYGPTGEAARSAFQSLALRALADQIDIDKSTVDNIYFCVTQGGLI